MKTSRKILIFVICILSLGLLVFSSGYYNAEIKNQEALRIVNTKDALIGVDMPSNITVTQEVYEGKIVGETSSVANIVIKNNMAQKINVTYTMSTNGPINVVNGNGQTPINSGTSAVITVKASVGTLFSGVSNVKAIFNASWDGGHATINDDSLNINVIQVEIKKDKKDDDASKDKTIDDKNNANVGDGINTDNNIANQNGKDDSAKGDTQPPVNVTSKDDKSNIIMPPPLPIIK